MKAVKEYTKKRQLSIGGIMSLIIGFASLLVMLFGGPWTIVGTLTGCAGGCWLGWKLHEKMGTKGEGK